MLRVLAIFRSLGILVLVFLKMCEDMPGFFVVFGIIAMAFASLLFGSGDPRGVFDKCENADIENYMYVNCTSYWWVLRTVPVVDYY
jgi:hypothetical protein